MLILRRISLKNFGPYKGSQDIVFPAESGVVVVYGENMRGKTSLLNAIRYGFFGYAMGRGEDRVDLEKLSNWEAVAEGIWGFSVTIAFDYGDDAFELTREYAPAGPGQSQNGAPELRHTRFLRREGNVLGPDECDAILQKVLPEAVSRFFLFDGELLQQYEDLLRQESKMGAEIKQAIERILGLPVLTNGRLDLKQLTEDAQRAEARAALKEKKTAELGTHHAQLLEQRAHLTQDLRRLSEERSNLLVKKAKSEEAMRKHRQAADLILQKDHLVTEVRDLERKLAEKQERARGLMANAWRWLLLPAIAKEKELVTAALATIQAEIRQDSALAETRRAFEAALRDGICSSCGMSLQREAREALEARLERLSWESDVTTKRRDEDALLQRRAALGAIPVTDGSEALSQLLIDLEDLRIELSERRDDIDEIREATRHIDDASVRALSSDHDKLVAEVTLLERGIAEQEAVIKQRDDDIRRVQMKLDAEGGAALAAVRRRREMFEGLQALFDDSVGEYRDQLRKRVENDATEVFRRLTTEPDYDRLRINESYGLTIVHKGGGEIPLRSAGAEHIVALSLMGALQRNAPLRGPIIMDSPFGRLDEGHTKRVVRTLPTMARQVLLLVYEAELEPGVAREELAGSLLREYRLDRRSAQHTVIVPYSM